jgi:hypothetical protein
MGYVLTNDTVQLPSTTVSVSSDGESEVVKWYNESQMRPIFRSEARWRVEDYIGYELTMVPEVECVFVEQEADSSFAVYTVVNERDLDVRSKIYDREMEILESNPGINIEFNILSRRNRPLESIIRSKEKPYRAFKLAA